MKFPIVAGSVALCLSVVSAGEVPDIREKHNEYRCLHDADDLTHDSALVDGSQIWADYLADGCSGLSHDESGYGENIFSCGTTNPTSPCGSATSAVKSWYDEVKDYNQGDGFSLETGHFTQLVWKASKSVGCARSNYCEGKGEWTGFHWQIVVCRYNPPGNSGDYNTNVRASAKETCTAGGNGDPHMSGFAGQKFDFSGVDNLWYALVHDTRASINMRVTAPVPGLDFITYITGIGMVLADDAGKQHTVVITVEDPSDLQPECPEGEYPCLADGALTVVVDGEKAGLGKAYIGDGVSVSAVNLPGACRPFGFEKYWLQKTRKSEESAEMAQSRRLMSELSMDEWILSDAEQTNAIECEEYVLNAAAAGTLFDLQSEHTSLQITSPALSFRVNHGKVHQVAMRDPTDQFDLPDHVAYQMNIKFEKIKLGEDPQGILGETIHPTLNELGGFVMSGSRAIRGEENDYLVAGPLATGFILDI